MVQCINVYNKELERYAADLKRSTVYFKDAANITVNSASVIMR